ncbi:endonuclease G [Maricaulis salignorans]|uniref:Endonuclease n=1 Tax=Maricaulis salignorans TaxID=144026 RepID=A0A1G9TM22_9PROT|nr:endonuclease G [Maricaulis salignorans]
MWRVVGALILRKLLVAALAGVTGMAGALPAGGQDIHIVHCYRGACPAGTPVSNDLVVREIYALSANDDTKLADWVAYRVTRETMGSSADLNRNWRTDEFLAEDETLEAGRGARDDYQGANRAHGYDRGHQAPLASFAGTPFWRSTNIYSNITPQSAALNQGAWVALETAVRDLAWAQRELYVLTGPLYERDMPGLDNAGEPHRVPSAYWKLVIDAAGNSTGFLFDQETPRDADYCDHRSTLAEIERRSGLVLVGEGLSRAGGDLGAALGCVVA